MPMDINFSVLIAVGNFIILVAGIVGGYFGLRSSMAKGSQALQDRVRQTLLDENQILQDRLKRVEELCKSDREALEKKLARVEGVVSTIRYIDRKSTRLNSSHTVISYAVFCLKKKKKKDNSYIIYSTYRKKIVLDVASRTVTLFLNALVNIGPL